MTHKHPAHIKHVDQASFGERAADRAAGLAGSWKFILCYVALTLAWTVINVVSPIRWDGYPYIFYTFSVSVLAILLSSVILLAGNRQSQIDRTRAELDFEVNKEAFDRIVRLEEQNKQILSRLDRRGQDAGDQNIGPTNTRG